MGASAETLTEKLNLSRTVILTPTTHRPQNKRVKRAATAYNVRTIVELVDFSTYHTLLTGFRKSNESSLVSHTTNSRAHHARSISHRLSTALGSVHSPSSSSQPLATRRQQRRCRTMPRVMTSKPTLLLNGTPLLIQRKNRFLQLLQMPANFKRQRRQRRRRRQMH